MSVRHFGKIHFSKPVCRRFSIMKEFLKNFTKLTESNMCRRLFSNEVDGCRLKRDSGGNEFPWILLNFLERLCSNTCANCCFWYLGITLRRNILYKGENGRNAVFSSILVFIYFKLILEFCITSEVYLEPYQTSIMMLLAACIFAETLHRRYLARF